MKNLIGNLNYGLYEYCDKYIFKAGFEGINILTQYIEINNQKSLTVEYDWHLDG